VSYSSGGGPGALAEAAAGGAPAGVAYAEDEVAYEEPAPVEQRRLDDEEQIGRNDPCWCGSGKKYKKCHGA
jgi:preprotein translocase subunit SecA